MSLNKRALTRATAVGTALQLTMVITGHFVAAVAVVFGPLGMALSLLAGLLYGRWAGRRGAWAGGGLAGGICALVGIAVSYGLGDVTAMILALGTLSSGVAGAIGGWVGARFAVRPAAATDA